MNSTPHQQRRIPAGRWRRDALFIAVCVVAVVGFAGSLLPELPTRHPLAELSPSRGEHPKASVIETAAAVDSAINDAALNNTSDVVASVPPADRLTVARRLWLALMGTIPSLEEIRQLEASTTNAITGDPPDAAEIDRMLDHVFADPRHADYLAERLARAYVGVEDGPFLLYRRRRFTAWLSDQLLENRPYDAVVREMLTARGLWTDQPAANFITVAFVDDNEDDRLDEALLTSRLSRALLGVRLDCAECHDHPFADWKQRDFQGLAAFFAGTSPSLGGIRDDDTAYEVADRQTGESFTVEPCVPFAASALPAAGSNRERLAGWLTSDENPAFARATVNRVWALLLGRPLVEPVDDVPVGAAAPQALDRLATAFATSGYDLRALIRTIAHTEAFGRASRSSDVEVSDATTGADSGWLAFPLTRLRPEQVVGALLQSAKMQTIDRESHVLVKLVRWIQQREFIERYGDAGAAELEPRTGTIPQRLVMMNGTLVTEKSGDNPLGTVARVALLAPDDAAAIETTYLAVLTRRPTQPEREHFEQRLAETELSRLHVLEDLYWSLVNSTEFSWNH
ncbi:MAG: DUF1553 domain-containing protein [Planctomycetales bacterium]|nr:DUF1553 domain-containing protein [Planctomycetales bacterium]